MTLDTDAITQEVETRKRREELLLTLPAEYQQLVHYIDMRFDAQHQQTMELIRTFQTAKSVLVAIKWLGGIAAAAATVYAAFAHGRVLP